MKTIKPRKFRSALDAAICYLIGIGIIEKDAEVVRATGVSKGNLSTFKNTGKYGDGFKTKFQDAYQLNLDKFNPDYYDPVSYIQKEKPGPSQEPDLLTLIKLAKVSLSEVEKAASLIVDLQTKKDPASQQVVLGKSRGDIGPHKKSAPRDKVSKKGN